MEDGMLKATLSYQKIADIYNVTYQATPWLQTTFRYTIFNPDNPARNTNDIDGLNDRSYSVKINVLDEGKYKPQVAIGAKDVLGTGAWNSEYIVASKKINNLDVTLGLGWGRLAEKNVFKNPFININEDFANRDKGTNTESIGGTYGGKLRSGSFFSGNQVGIFGGIKYTVPNTNLSLLAEYNSDSYQREINKGTIPDSSPLSIGVKWNGLRSFDIGLSYQQGNQAALSISSKINTKADSLIPKIDPFYSSYDGYELSGADESLNLDSWYHRLFFDLGKSGILLRTAKVIPEENKIIMELTNLQYNLTADALSRAFTLSQIHIPQEINKIEVIINETGYQLINIVYQKDSLGSYSLADNKGRLDFLDARAIENPTHFTRFSIPHAAFDVNLYNKFQLFDPQNPVKYQIYLKTAVSISLPKEWNILGIYATNIYNDFDMNFVDKNSALPHVRSDINEYLVQGESGIDSLYLEKRSKYRDLYYRAYFGILETMYSGLGIELLYQPSNKSRLALGATINKVRKRGFKRNFDLLDYKTTTGFLSLFYASPFYNYDFALHLGRYLAKDRGATIEMRRTFDNGFVVGAFATFTNVSAAVFGEGSFDKGLYFKIPFNAFGPNTKSSYATTIRSVQRDGGQRIDDFSGRLWHDLRNVRYDSLRNHKERMMPK